MTIKNPQVVEVVNVHATQTIQAHRVCLLGTNDDTKTQVRSTALVPVTTATADGIEYGITEKAIGPGERGTVVVSGKTRVETDGGVSAGDELMTIYHATDASLQGTADTSSDAEESWGYALAADFTSTDTEDFVPNGGSTAAVLVDCVVNFTTTTGIASGTA